MRVAKTERKNSNEVINIRETKEVFELDFGEIEETLVLVLDLPLGFGEGRKCLCLCLCFPF